MAWSLKQCQSALAQTHFAAFGLWQGDDLLAYISFYHIAGEVEIANLAVASSMRQRGIGRHLLLLALHTAHKMGMQRAVLEVRKGNLVARKLYESAGFALQGVRKGYFTDNGEDALVYCCQF